MKLKELLAVYEGREFSVLQYNREQKAWDLKLYAYDTKERPWGVFLNLPAGENAKKYANKEIKCFIESADGINIYLQHEDATKCEK